MGGVPGYPWLHSESWPTYDSQNKIIEKKETLDIRSLSLGVRGGDKPPLPSLTT